MASEGVSWTPEEARAWWATHLPLDSASTRPSNPLKSGQAQGDPENGFLPVIGIDWRAR